MLRATMGALAGGFVGAAIWAAVAWFAEFEIGWLAWGVGALVGVGAARLDDGEPSRERGVLAAAIALVAVLGGRFAVVAISVEKALGEARAEANAMDPEVLLSYVADEVADEWTTAGRELDWPKHGPDVIPSRQIHYPEDVWREATTRWEGWSEAERADFEAGVLASIDADLADAGGQARLEWFLESFSPIDLLFFFLAVVTAFRIAGQGAAVRET